MISRRHIRRLCAPLLASLLLTAAAQAQDTVAVRTERLTVQYVPTSGRLVLGVLDEAGQVVHRTEAPGLYLDGQAQRGLSIIETAPQPVLQNEQVVVAFEVVGPRAIAVTWAARDSARHDFNVHLLSTDETHYYGTGERFNALDQRGYLLPLLVDDRYGNKGVGSYKPIPFFMSTDGLGVWVDSFAPGTFDLSASERFLTQLRFPEKELRVVFMGGPQLSALLQTFTELTGRPPVPPPWAFGLWKSRDVHPNQDSVLVDLEKLRRHDVPASVLVLDSPWETGYNDFVVNRQQFSDPEAMFREIQARGFYLCLWLTPFINRRNVQDMEGITVETRTYGEAAEGGYLVEDTSGAIALSTWWKGKGGLVDFTDPAAVDWWYTQLDRMRDYGVRAFKCDDREGNFVPDAVFHDGTPAYKMKNRYAVLYNRAMQEYVNTRLDSNGVLITRSGYTGTQNYPFAWAGDNRGNFSYDDGLPSVILAGQNAALSGISLWGSDIAGYAGTPTKEVFIRWTQFSTFTPLMQVHMTANLGPWDFDQETLTIFRQYARLRTELFPYLYNAAHEAARIGMPVMRPMVLAFPDDPEAHRHLYQFLFGPDLLVAPMYQPGTERAVYLPAGTWYDYWTGTRYDGPQTVMVEAPLKTIPLFVRAGSLIPRLPDDVQTLIPRHDAMNPDIVALDARRVLQVWPGPEGSLATQENFSADLAQEGNDAVLRVSSETMRPLEVHLMHQQVDPGVEEGTVRQAPDRTVITWPSFRGRQTLRWRPTSQH